MDPEFTPPKARGTIFLLLLTILILAAAGAVQTMRMNILRAEFEFQRTQLNDYRERYLDTFENPEMDVEVVNKLGDGRRGQ